MITVKHWKRSGFSCEHTANSTKGALVECLRCRGLSTAGAEMLSLLVERNGHAEYLVKDETFVFRAVAR